MERQPDSAQLLDLLSGRVRGHVTVVVFFTSKLYQIHAQLNFCEHSLVYNQYNFEIMGHLCNAKSTFEVVMTRELFRKLMVRILTQILMRNNEDSPSTLLFQTASFFTSFPCRCHI